MSSLLEPLKCPECGANIKMSPDGKSAFCPYCKMTCLIRQPEPVYREPENDDDDDDDDGEPVHIRVNINLDDLKINDDTCPSSNTGMMIFYIITGVVMIVLGIIAWQLFAKLNGRLMPSIAVMACGVLFIINGCKIDDDTLFGFNKKLVNWLGALLFIICLFL